MAPSVVIDNTPDFDFPTKPVAQSTTNSPRTLLLAPASVAAHPQVLTQVSQAYDRNATDIQMLDRLALGLVSLPKSTYDLILLLTDVDASTQAPRPLLNREVTEKLVQSLKNGGRLQSQDGSFGQQQSSADQTEAILAGLVADGANGMVKPETFGSEQTVKLNFGNRRKQAANGTEKAQAAAVPANAVEEINLASIAKKETNGSNGTQNGPLRSTPAGVGFINNDDELDGGYEDEDEEMEFPSDEQLENAGRIDPDSLLSEADRQKPLVIPEACKPNTKRRRACKDCSCGLAERLAAEDKATRAEADANLARLNAADLTEVDFTVQGKVGSCGNCALGDAFRCDGCPYIGLPAFKPGEEVRLLTNDVQL